MTNTRAVSGGVQVPEVTNFLPLNDWKNFLFSHKLKCLATRISQLGTSKFLLHLEHSLAQTEIEKSRVPI